MINHWAIAKNKKGGVTMTRFNTVTLMLGAAALAVLACAGQAQALTGSSADLFLPDGGVPTIRLHPADIPAGGDAGGPLWNPQGNYWFNIYTGSSADFASTEGFTQLVEMESTFYAQSTIDPNDVLAGSLTSRVYRQSDSHLLFAYQFANDGDIGISEMSLGNLAGFGSDFDVVDTGVLHFDTGNSGYDNGDILSIGRTADVGTGNNPSLTFAFEAAGWNILKVERWLMPGDTSSWFYVETDAELFTIAPGVVQNGVSAGFEAFVPMASPESAPIPEPITLAGVMVAMASLGGYIRKNRK